MDDLTRTVAVDVGVAPAPPARAFRWPWPLVVIAAGIGVAAAGWVLLAGVATVVWVASSDAALGDALRLATQVFALAHGAPADVAGQPITLIPLGWTFLLVFLAQPVVAFAARQAADGGGDTDEAGEAARDRERTVWWVGGAYAATYVAAVGILVGAVLDGQSAARALLGAAIVGVVAGLRGASKGVGHSPTAAWPGWLRAVPRAMAAAVLTVLAAGLAAAVTAVIVGWDRVVAITEGLEPGAVGVAGLVVLHLAYLPNLVLWAASWLLGAGITLGDGSLVSLLITDVGLLPALPVLGAVPEPGVASPLMLWWLAGGVAAGAVAAVVVVRARPRARFDETALVGGLSGVLAGAFVALLASLASGGLGADRLAHIGARTGELLVFAPTILGLSGLAAGLVIGLLRRPRAAAAADAETDPDPVTTPEESA